MAKDLKINTSDGALGNTQKLGDISKGKHPGGRKPKKGLKNENFTISLDPILFEKYQIIAQRTNKASFSEFLRQAVEVFCKENNISLYDEKLNEEALANYEFHKKEKMDRKASKPK